MTPRQRLWTTLFFLPLAGGVAVLFFSLRGGRTSGGEPPVAQPSTAELAPEPERVAVELIPPVEVRRAAGGDTRTNVLWPLKIELELLEASYLPKEDGVVPVGSGASARLSGQVTGEGDEGVKAEVAFVAGANTGRVQRTDEGGRFGAADLYPGLSIVGVRGNAILGSRREIRLRRNQETLLNIGFGRPGSVQGRVQDSDGKGLEGAAILIDGTRVTSGPEGEFHLGAVAAGQVLVEVEREGYARYQELVHVTGGGITPVERMTFTLKPAAELRVAIKNNIGAGPVQLFLFSDRVGAAPTSATAHRNMSYPWHRVNPVEVYPGRPVTIGALPPEVVKVHAFRSGAEGELKVVNLRTDRPYDLEIELEAAPLLTGRVTFEGQPVAGASVRLEAPDRVRATLAFFSEPSYMLEGAVMPHLPPALQQVTTAKDGRFELTAWAEESPVRYLEARGPDGRTWAGRFVRAKDRDVEIALAAVDLGESELELEFPGRFQALPVEIWIGGAPHAEEKLPAEEELSIAKLLSGRWSLRIGWHGQPVFEEAALSIEGTTRRSIPLPPECIEGQDEEAWKRAGREYPESP